MPAQRMKCEICQQEFHEAYLQVLERGDEILYVCASCYQKAREISEGMNE
jgi:ribosome-binding protein aMBF1 (putative translation factor)